MTPPVDFEEALRRPLTTEFDPSRVDNVGYLIGFALDVLRDACALPMPQMHRQTMAVYAQSNALYYMRKAPRAIDDADIPQFRQRLLDSRPPATPISSADLCAAFEHQLPWQGSTSQRPQTVLKEFLAATITVASPTTIRQLLELVVMRNSRFKNPKHWGIDLDAPIAAWAAQRAVPPPQLIADPATTDDERVQHENLADDLVETLVRQLRNNAKDLLTPGASTWTEIQFPALLLAVAQYVEYRWISGDDSDVFRYQRRDDVWLGYYREALRVVIPNATNNERNAWFTRMTSRGYLPR